MSAREAVPFEDFDLSGFWDADGEEGYVDEPLTDLKVALVEGVLAGADTLPSTSWSAGCCWRAGCRRGRPC